MDLRAARLFEACLKLRASEREAMRDQMCAKSEREGKSEEKGSCWRVKSFPVG